MIFGRVGLVRVPYFFPGVSSPSLAVSGGVSMGDWFPSL